MTEIDINQLLKILPQLIRENDTVKGAIITALSGVIATREDIRDLIKEMDKRFEATDKRFEAMDKRFEAMDKRFEAMQKQIDTRFERVDNALTDLKTSNKIMQVSIARIEGKTGIQMEQLILSILQNAFKLHNIDPSKIHKEKIVDAEGRVFWKGYSSDIDVLFENGNVYLMEIKSSITKDEIAHFLENIKLFKMTSGKKVTRGILAVVKITQEMLDYVKGLQIQVIYGEIISD